MLDLNIKCGNSLITKKFNWEKEFPEIFQNNNPGFKIVLANPPYNAKIPQKQRTYQTNKYITGAGDTTIAFMHLIQNTLLNKNGRTGYIIPKSSVFTPKFQPIRENILQSIETIIDCEKVWNNVKLEQEIFIIDKNNNKDYYNTGKRENEEIVIKNQIPKSTHKAFGVLSNSVNEKELAFGLKVKENSKSMHEIINNVRGPGGLQSKTKEIGDLKVIGSRNFTKAGIVDYRGKIDENDLESKPQAFLKDNAILVQRIANMQNNHLQFKACVANNIDEYVINDSVQQFVLKTDKYSKESIAAIINSKALNYYVDKFGLSQAKMTINLTKEVSAKLPMPNMDANMIDELNNIAKELDSNYKDLGIRKNKFITNITNNFKNVNTNKKAIKEFETTTFTKFKNSLPTTLTLKQQEEWNEYLTETQKECQEIIKTIEEKENKINQLIYKAYGLNEEEIAIIEGSLK